jgi:CheY-like chemotaxis protein
MPHRLNSVLLVDDDKDCSFLHKIIIGQSELAQNIFEALNGHEAINFINEAVAKNQPLPEIIFLDINMPGMNGWEFLEEYGKLEEAIKEKIVVIMLSASINPDDERRALNDKNVRAFYKKNLNEEYLKEIEAEYFSK